jgi:hypothetical protein
LGYRNGINCKIEDIFKTLLLGRIDKKSACPFVKGFLLTLPRMF